MTLYAMMNMIPPPHMRTYDTVLLTASSGALMSLAIGSAKTRSAAVSTTPTMTKNRIAEPSIFPALSVFLLPMKFPKRTVIHVARPVRTNVTRFMILLPVDTPENPSVEPNQPTMRTSTAPYAACRISAPRIGSMKRINLPAIRPSVKSEDVFSMAEIIPYILRLIMFVQL